MKFVFPNKAKKIEDKFFEFSFDDRDPQPEDYKLLDSASSLHYLADIYNWDDGEEVLDWIISNPKCDKGTALMIFWRAEPDYYTRYQDETDADHDAEEFRFVKKIIHNFETGFYKREQIHYDPSADGHDVDYIDKNAKWEIPDLMKKSTKGGNVYYIPDPIDLIQKWWSDYKRKQHRKKRKKRLSKN